MIIHASLVSDLVRYNTDWLLNILIDGVYEKRFLNKQQVYRYNFTPFDIEKVYFWTSDPRELIKKIHMIDMLGYKYEIINEINFYSKVVTKEQKQESILNNLIRNIEKIPHYYLSYGPIFISNIYNIEWHIGQFEFLWSLIPHEHIHKIYLNFNTSSNLIKNNEYEALDNIQKLKFIKQIEEIVGKDISIIEKPSYYQTLNNSEFDLGEENFCFSKSFIKEGLENPSVRNTKIMLHKPLSKSLYLDSNNEEEVININLVDLNNSRTHVVNNYKSSEITNKEECEDNKASENLSLFNLLS